MKIGIINYGVGNIRSVYNSIYKLIDKVEVVENPDKIKEFDKIVLPGTGSYANSIEILKNNHWFEEIKDFVEIKQKYILGICLGMQLFSNVGFEDKKSYGFNFIDGEVKSLFSIGCNLKLPLIGWNNIKFKKESNMLSDVDNLSDVYFVNSYSLIPKKISVILTTSNYGIDFVSSVEKDNIIGTQFHPEKSSHAGRKILKNFIDA
jgi:imidazole glycerol-phosphate synthase subunit HisH